MHDWNQLSHKKSATKKYNSNKFWNERLTSHAFKNLTTKRKKLILWIIIEFNNTRSNITFDLHLTLQHNHNKKNSKHIKMQSIMEKKSQFYEKFDFIINPKCISKNKFWLKAGSQKCLSICCKLQKFIASYSFILLMC